MTNLQDLELLVQDRMCDAVVEHELGHGLKDIYIEDEPRGVGVALARVVTEIFQFCIVNEINIHKCLDLLRDQEERKL